MRILLLSLALLLSPTALAGDFKLHSPDLTAGERIPSRHVLDSFGCNGDNQSPALRWSDAPKGTQSFAITVHDPDAPTASGWWHWLAYNIPASATGVARGASRDGMPKTTQQARNDFGSRNWGGPCPPAGDQPHQYKIRVYALDQAKLKLPADASAALVSFQVRSHALAQDTLTVSYSR